MIDLEGKYKGKPVYVLCRRYAYRGTLNFVNHVLGCLELENASAVTESGPASGEKPRKEDPLDGPVTIFFSSIESISQPNFVHAPIPNWNKKE